jgi:Flp pilus assembly protein TadD
MQAALAALEKGNLEAAVSHLQAVKRISPKNPRAYVTLGVVFQMLGRAPDAEKEFTLALHLSPNELPALFGLGATKAESGEHEEAESLLREVVARDPSNIQAHVILVRTLRDLGRFEEAESESRAAIAAHPLEPAPYSALAAELQEFGRFEEARALFTKSIELDPGHTFGYLGLVRGQPMTQSDQGLIDRMESAVALPHLRPDDRIELLSGLGKAYDDLGEYGKAMARFSESNRIANEEMQARSPFSKAAFVRYLDAPKAVLTKDYIDAHRSANESTPRPIFIVGMMRSGTTLIERILSSHPSVEPGNEIKYWTPETYKCIDIEGGTFDFHHALGNRKKYNRLLRKISPDARFVTDKMPDNYRVLGAISMLYPEAKIIHCMRHPVDTCLSILTTPFRKPADYARDPELLVFVYRKYQELMAHWQSILPESALLDVRYEELIDDPEQATRKMVEFCGLEWSDACLRPEENSRPVVTASVWQVRQPVYRTSIERWRHYEPWLGPLAALLEPSA